MIKIFTIILLLGVSLFARINPFEPDVNYEPSVEQKLKPKPIKKPLETYDDGKRTVKIEGTQTKNLLVKEAVKTKVIIKEKIIKVKPTKDELEALCKVSETPVIIKTPKAKKIPNKKFVREETKIIKHYNQKSHGVIPRTYKVLPFVSIYTNYNSLEVSSRPKYSIVTYHALKGKKRVAFDFLADVWFYSRDKRINTKYFKQYKVGNHKKQGFFRVTINLKDKIKNYTISIKNNKATITHK